MGTSGGRRKWIAVILMVDVVGEMIQPIEGDVVARLLDRDGAPLNL